jgi:hypothetical protein
MRRRDLITLLAGAAAWPVVVRARQPVMPVVGFLHLGSAAPFAYTASAVREGLKQFGYIENQNVAIEYRWANNEPGRLPELASDLVNRQVAVIIAMGTNLPGRQQRPPPRPFQSSSYPVPILCEMVSSRDSTGRAVTSLE